VSKEKTKANRSPKSGKRGPGRPRIEFDLAAVEGLGQIGATAAEMVSVLPASQATIEHRMADRESDFYKAYEKGRGLLKTSLRRKQIQVALAGSHTMLIWLGKQLLGQSDRHDQVSSNLNVNLASLTDDQLERLAGGDDMRDVLAKRGE
jgi:hypothetical protein